MWLSTHLVPIVALAMAAAASASGPGLPDVLKLVDPLIGSSNGGNVFAGASLPYGMAKAVADVQLPDAGGAATGGFATDRSSVDGSTAAVTGFSALHDSGSGGNPSLGNFPLFPQMCQDDVNTCRFRLEDRQETYDPASVVARPGYFALRLATSSIGAEMTVADKTALFRFSFPLNATGGNSGTPAMLLDLTDLRQSRQNASVSVDETTGRMTGSGVFLPSFGAGTYELHFCADFYGSDILDSGVWVNSRGGTEPKEISVPRGFNVRRAQCCR